MKQVASQRVTSAQRDLKHSRQLWRQKPSEQASFFRCALAGLSSCTALAFARLTFATAHIVTASLLGLLLLAFTVAKADAVELMFAAQHSTNSQLAASQAATPQSAARQSAVPGSAAPQSTSRPSLNQQALAEFARHTRLEFALIANGFAPNGKPSEGKLHAQIRLTNQSPQALPRGQGNWQIYFHAIRKFAAEPATTQSLSNDGLVLEHVQGDLHRLSPTAQFKGLAPQQSLTIDVVGGPWIVSYSDWMPRAFIVAKGLTPEVFRNTDTEQLADFVAPFSTAKQQLRHAKDLFTPTTTESRYHYNERVNQAELAPAQALDRIIPTPQHIQYQRGRTEFSHAWQIQYQGQLRNEAHYLQTELKKLGFELNTEPLASSRTNQEASQGTSAKAQQRLILTIDATLKTQSPEAYRLQILSDRVLISGADNAGVFYGVQSLLNLIPAPSQLPVVSYALPQLVAMDAPRYAWRGMHYDMARNFHGKAVTLQLIEQMARYKMNKLHLHLTEDEGWRLEIPGLPELTDIGGTRCFDLSEQRCLLTQLGTGPHKTGSGNGFYTRADFIEILKFAAERHIEVIPEIDMPGHARAAVVAMKARFERLAKTGQLAAANQYLLSDPKDQSVYLTVQNYTDNSVNVCMESTYRFIDKVVYELQQMYREAGLKLTTYHMGGDEVGAGSWQKSPACQQLFAQGLPGLSGVQDLKPYFVSRVAELLQKRQLALGGWEDGLMYDAKTPFNRSQFANERVYANVWDNIWEWGVADRAYRLANAGYQVVLSHGTHLYLDHPNEVAAEERGYYWAARYTDVQKIFGYMPDHLYANADKTLSGEVITDLATLLGRSLPQLEQPQNILGIQGQVWSETIRTAAQLQQMVFPRLLPIAERAWYRAPWEAEQVDDKRRDADYQAFAQTMTLKELPKLVHAGIQLHLPPPGAHTQQSVLHANSAYPGLLIEYSLDQGQTWQRYREPVALQTQGLKAGQVWLRSRLQEPTGAGSPSSQNTKPFNGLTTSRIVTLGF